VRYNGDRTKSNAALSMREIPFGWLSMVTQKIYHAAIYVRLSKEDGDVAAAGKAESNSISNQKNLIKEFQNFLHLQISLLDGKLGIFPAALISSVKLPVFLSGNQAVPHIFIKHAS